MTKLILSVLWGLSTTTVGFPSAHAQTYTSSKTQTHMLELFSTQSCSSCPPAQDWVSQLKKSKKLWKTFIPIVFHVDYWDYLGWKDPYSSPIYSTRQRDYVSEWFKTPAYTPMFVLDGEVTRSSYASEPMQSQGKTVGVLKAKKLDSSGNFKVRFQPSDKYSNPLVVYYSIIGSGIATKVKSGENEGKILKHDFLSLKMDKVDMKKRKASYEAIVNVDRTSIPSAPKNHIIFWVSEDVSKKPIQVVGGPL